MTNSLRQKLGLKAVLWPILLGYLLLAATPLFAQEVPGGEALAPLYYLMLGVALIFYIYFAIALQAIAGKTGTANGWWAWIPILQIVLSLKIARKPMWWLILCLVPFLNWVMLVLVWMGIAKVRNRPSWWGILVLVPIANFVILGILAWSGGSAIPVAADSGNGLSAG
jgi:hypothetical protein